MKLSIEMTLDQSGEIKKQLRLQKTTVKALCDAKDIPYKYISAWMCGKVFAKDRFGNNLKYYDAIAKFCRCFDNLTK